METQSHISQWGDSLVLPIPKQIAEYLKLSVNDLIICSIENGKLVLSPVQKSSEYTLEKLLAGAIEPGEEVSWGKTEGEEIW